MKMKIEEEPYSYICDFFEDRYKYAGEKFFQYGSLLVASAALPKYAIPGGGKEEMPTLHLLVVGNSGSGKSDLLKQVNQLAYKSELLGKITEAQMEYKIGKMREGTLLINDLKRNLETEGFEKVFEGIVDGFVSRETTRTKMKGEVKVSSIGAGVHSDLKSKKLFGGFLPRLMPIFLIYQVEKQKDVADKISEQYIKKTSNELDFNTIRSYYRTLIDIQKGKKEEQVKDFKFSKKGAKNLTERFKIKIDEIGSQNKYYFRDLKYGFRMAINHAFLNYFNRKIVDNVLYVDEKDFEIAADLMDKEIKKKDLLMSNEKARKTITEMPGEEEWV